MKFQPLAGIAQFAANSQVFLSIAGQPSLFGFTLFNKAFQSLGIDALYKPMQVEPGNLEEAIRGLRGLGIRGCGVSMPHKSTAMAYLDHIDEQAARIGAINTIVNDCGKLTGYNTDHYAATQVFQDKGLRRGDQALILGAGGVARAVVTAMVELGIHAYVCARDAEVQQDFAQRYGSFVIPWRDRNSFSAKALVNCTPVGMEPITGVMPLNKSAVRHFEVIGDLVAKPPVTALISEAERENLVTMPGHSFLLHQAAKQFELYTGRKDAGPHMREALTKLLGISSQ